MRPLVMVPELLLFGGGLAVLSIGSFVPRQRQWWTGGLAAAVLVAAIAAAAVEAVGPRRTAFEGIFCVDTPTGVARILAAAGALFTMAVAVGEIRSSARESETYALVLFSTAGVLVMAGATDLLVLATGYLLTSIPLYGLIGLPRTATAAEAAMKAYLMGALFGIVLLLGISVLYGVTGATGYDELAGRLGAAPAAVVAAGIVAVLAGLMFEAGSVPAHFWVPDSAEGANGTAAMFLTTVPKIGALIAVYRLATVFPTTVHWPLLVALFAVTSMTLGNLAAYWQHDPRRLLGWSTVSQVGFLLVPITVIGRSDLAVPSLLFYLGGYTLTNSAAFAVTTALPGKRELSSYRGLARARPWLAAALIVALLGLVGTPPTAVFVGKLTTATAAWDGGQAWLAVAVFANSLISLFYYLRWIIPSIQQRAEDSAGQTFSPNRWSAVTAVMTAALSVLVGIFAGAIWPLLA